MVFTVGFAMATAVFTWMVVDGGAVALVFAVPFGAATIGFFRLSSPTWVFIDGEGVRFIHRFRKRRVRWSEIERVGTGFRVEGMPGTVNLHLTETAAAERRLHPPNLHIEALEECDQDELLEVITARWIAAGGSGETFTALGDFKKTTQTLVETAGMLVELQRRDNPFLDEMIEKKVVKPELAALAARGRAAMRARENVRLGGDESATEGIYASVLHVHDDADRLYFVVVAGGEPRDALCAELRRTVRRLVAEHRFNPEFGGEIRIELVPDLTQRLAALDEAMDALIAELPSELAGEGTTTAARAPIRIEWRRGEPNAAR